MFVLTNMREMLSIPPAYLSMQIFDAITLELNRIFLDKVIKNVGLCISVYDILDIEGGVVAPGDGAPMYSVAFRLVIFRPFIGEILLGKLKKCDKQGATLSVGFFDDIHVPVAALPQPCIFNEEEQLWVWSFNGDEFFMDLDQEVRFRVTKVRYPPLPLEQERDAAAFAPMEIIADLNADGLGLTAWW